MSHTPGPWIAGWSGDPEAQGMDDAGPINIVAFGRGGVAVCQPIRNAHASTWPVVQANANLIAAAPDLLAALKLILQSHEPNCPGETCHLSGIDLARAAIAKAEGRA